MANGICPITAKRAERASTTTFAECAENWIATHKPGWRTGSAERNARILLFNHGHALLHQPVNKITPDKVQKALADVWTRYPAQGRRALDMIARVLDFAKAKGFRSGDNPAAWKGCHQYRLPKRRTTDKSHYSALPYEAVPEFIRSLRVRQERSAAASALEFTILITKRLVSV